MYRALSFQRNNKDKKKDKEILSRLLLDRVSSRVSPSELSTRSAFNKDISS